MAEPLLWGNDRLLELLGYTERNQGKSFCRSGMFVSDTVRAVLALAEYVLRLGAVARFGGALLESINNPSRRAAEWNSCTEPAKPVPKSTRQFMAAEHLACR